MSDIDLNKIRRLDFGLLLVFRELLRLRRASAVAERLGLSQPAISHALGRLRELFDDQLFIRRPHGFEPTRRALDLGPKIEALIALSGEALTPQAGFDPATSRRLFAVAAPEFVTALIGAELIQRFAAVAPGVTFAIGHASEDEAYKALRRGECDLALGRFGAPRAGYVVEPLFEDVYAVIARQGHPTVATTIDEAGWRATGHIFAWSRSETAAERPPEGSREFPGMTMLAAVPHWLTVMMLVASTDGIGTVPRRLAERHAERLGLQVLDIPFAEPEVIRVSAVRRAGIRDPGLDWFLGEVRAAVG
ncbi:LysR family transcriptional regulator [Phenylobacterium sp.]|uniref:LysR family transcriptional regulator n=1 Tax=Phenylobacterium sp. TaxID=1871053 RepID=UPI0035AE2626